MFDKTHCDRRSNNYWQDPLLFLVDEYLVDFLLKDDSYSVVEHCLRARNREEKAQWMTQGSGSPRVKDYMKNIKEI